MGLNTIETLIEKKGNSYVNKLLDEEVVITEKLDTFRILFEKQGDKLLFFKKDNTPITLVERTLTDIWESAILEIPALINETELPEGIRFGVAYTPVERPLRIPYSNLPRYILTDMSKRKNGKIIESYDYEEVTHWAGILCMAKPPILFEGKLSEEQKNILISYDTKEYDGSNDTFAQMIKKVLNKSYSNEDIIEGIIIKSGKSIAQIISYEFEILNEAYKKINVSRDFYDIVLLSINNFMDSYKFPSIVTESSDEIYIEIISDIFEQYCATEKINEGFEPKYLTAPQYGHIGNLNKKFIKNQKALKYINEDPIYEALYKVFLSSFRKFKKPYGLLSENVVNKFNTYVAIIANKTKEELQSIEYIDNYDNKLNESGSDNIVVKTLKRRIPNDIDNMKVIASVQKTFMPPSYKINTGKQKCAVYLTDFMPFTSAQMTNIEQIHNQWNVPIILASVSNKKQIKGKKFHLTDETVIGQMKTLSNFNKALIPSFMLLDTWNLKEIFEYCRPQYEPLIIMTDKGKKSDLSLQLFFEEEVMGGKINVLPEFNIGEMENKESIMAYRSIEDGNGSMFIELTPKAIHNFYNNIINEYRIWEGTILTQFEPTIYPEIK